VPVARLAPDRIISDYAELPAAVRALMARAAPGVAVND
jgi:hypothetical protein